MPTVPGRGGSLDILSCGTRVWVRFPPPVLDLRRIVLRVTEQADANAELKWNPKGRLH